ncbi:MAG: polymer-forming cytoskeletal protein [Nitrospinaceae bacterium]|nr:polymer-forming cytoskeletal protein [Nitrospinaceae bacterium]NIR54703.1 polymer-forming cytoskeletal protein [Nitrospinaceae bacterium]NIS85124.1 polymer-forming cytoskeletal protein [Nitrospinaceae bacterium]NIT81941.1 polymer-forming cytoskeletal protein [Nitrospinaceae bacterium]NIU44202.1 polymer-forming cytoskeletal protein [Nitrospinaceae bacterium]
MTAKNPESTKDIKAYLGEDTVFSGTLTFNGAVRVDGRMDGEVNTDDTLIVGETGILEADINAGTVICRGKIKGTIKAAKRIEIHTNSEVVGNISAPSLLVETGALFDGHCDMSGNDSKIVKLVPNEETEAAGTR